MLTKKDKDNIKAYRLWAEMKKEDEHKLIIERRAQNVLELHNAHMAEKFSDGYYICQRAQDEYAKRLNLYPQGN